MLLAAWAGADSGIDGAVAFLDRPPEEGAEDADVRLPGAGGAEGGEVGLELGGGDGAGEGAAEVVVEAVGEGAVAFEGDVADVAEGEPLLEGC